MGLDLLDRDQRFRQILLPDAKRRQIKIRWREGALLAETELGNGGIVIWIGLGRKLTGEVGSVEGGVGCGFVGFGSRSSVSEYGGGPPLLAIVGR